MDGNIHNLQDAMEWLDRSIREEAELNDEMSNEHAIQLGFIQNMLTKFPRRNCDEETPEEQVQRFKSFCKNHSEPIFKDTPKLRACRKACPFRDATGKLSCFARWMAMPYEKGAADEK